MRLSPLRQTVILCCVLAATGCSTSVPTTPNFGKPSATAGVPTPNLSFDSDISRWIETPSPDRLSDSEKAEWRSAASSSKYQWRVVKEGGTFNAALIEGTEFPPTATERQKLPFIPNIGPFSTVAAVYPVDDGWLIGFAEHNEGLRTGALYWFDRRGRINKKLSDGSILAILKANDQIVAVEGDTDSPRAFGTIFKIVKHKEWEAHLATLLPESPQAVTTHGDGWVILVLEDSVAMYIPREPRDYLTTFRSNAGWRSLQPNSVVNDNLKFYIGMRQFVAEYDWRERTVRYLVPNKAFLTTMMLD